MKLPVCTVFGLSNTAGLKMARYYSQKGYHVALLDFSRKKLEEVQLKMRAYTEHVNAFIVEGIEYADLQYAFQKIYAHLGGTEVFIYNFSNADLALAQNSPEFFKELRYNIAKASYSLDQVMPSMLQFGKGEIIFTGKEFDLSSAHALPKGFISNLIPELQKQNIKLITSVQNTYRVVNKTDKRIPYNQTVPGKAPRAGATPQYVKNPSAYSSKY